MDFIAFRALTSIITDVPSKSFRNFEVPRLVIDLLLFLFCFRHRDTDTNFSIVLCHLIVGNTVLNRSFLDDLKFCLLTELCNELFVSNYFLVLVHSLSSNFSELTPQFPSSDFHSSQPNCALEQEEEVYSQVDSIEENHGPTCLVLNFFVRLEIREAHSAINHEDNSCFVEILQVIV
jgi:hypothetical protein